MKKTPVKTKSYAFAIRIVKLFQWLCATPTTSKKKLSFPSPPIAMNSFACSLPSRKRFARKASVSTSLLTRTRFSSMRLLTPKS